MSIASGDILFMLSVPTAVSGNHLPQADVNASLGKYLSTTEITPSTLNNLFDNITGDENAASGVDYRGFFVRNAHGSLTLQSPKLWIYSEVAGGASVAIGVDPEPATPITATGLQMATIATEADAPAGVSFSAPTTKGTGLSVGDLPAGYCRGVWIRRTAANTAAQASDGATLRLEGDSL